MVTLDKGVDRRMEMNDALVNYLAGQKSDYERGLVLKADVLLWSAVYAENDTEILEAEHQIEEWDG